MTERWTSVDAKRHLDQTVSSMSMYDLRAKQWHHSWFDSFGNTVQLDRELLGNSMLMQGRRSTFDGHLAIERTRWSPLPSGQVRRLWDYALDGGTTWKTRLSWV